MLDGSRPSSTASFLLSRLVTDTTPRLCRSTFDHDVIATVLADVCIRTLGYCRQRLHLQPMTGAATDSTTARHLVYLSGRHK